MAFYPFPQEIKQQKTSKQIFSEQNKEDVGDRKMSLDRCLRCDSIVDTDEDGDCYPETWRTDGSKGGCLCEKCRDEVQEEMSPA